MDDKTLIKSMLKASHQKSELTDFYIDGSNAKIQNTTFANNRATFFGAAITGWNSSAFVLENCKILNNEVQLLAPI